MVFFTLGVLRADHTTGVGPLNPRGDHRMVVWRGVKEVWLCGLAYACECVWDTVHCKKKL